MRLRTLASVLLCALSLASCAKRRDSITLAGSTAFLPFAETLAEAYMEANDDADLSVQGGGSALGINAALSGTAQIGMADLVELPAEAAGLDAVVVARDAISLVLHPANPVSDLGMEAIRAVFNGEIRNWKALGGPDKTITVVSREAGSGTRSSFEKMVRGISLAKEALIQDSNGTVRETVANDPAAIGYLSHGLVNERIKAVSIGGVAATPESAASGEYPLVRPIYFLIKGSPAGEVKEFIDYVLGPEGQAAIAGGGLLPVR